MSLAHSLYLNTLTPSIYLDAWSIYMYLRCSYRERGGMAHPQAAGGVSRAGFERLQELYRLASPFA